MKATLKKHLHLDKKCKKQKRREQGLTNFKLDFSELLETESAPDVANVEHPEHHTSQKLDNVLSAERWRSRILNEKGSKSFVESKRTNIQNENNVPAAVLDDLFGKFF